MSQRNEHLIVVMLQPAPRHEFEVWPPHITLVPWFPVDDAGRLDKLLSALAARHQPIKVQAGPIEQWGDGEKFNVQLVKDPSSQLHSLHWDMAARLAKDKFAIHQKELLGRSYKPHITLRNSLSKSSQLPLNQEIIIDQFSLFAQARLKGSGRMIKSLVRSYELGQ